MSDGYRGIGHHGTSTFGNGPVKVAVLDDYQDVALSLADWSPLHDLVHVTAFHDHQTDDDEVVARLEAFDIVVLMRERTPLRADRLARLGRLRSIVTTGMANDAVDVVEARRLGMEVQGTGGWAGVATTVELTWGLILAAARGIARQDAAIRSGGWQEGLGMGLAGRRLGIVGLGNLGSQMPPIGRAFGMDVVAWSQNMTAEHAAAAGATLLDRDSFFATSDVVSVHLKLGPRSVGYVGEADLRRMKPTAVLVNTSRGPVVDEAALVRALEEGWIAAAGLDVFGHEPLPPDHPFRRLPNCVVSPHVGYVTQDTYAQYYPQIVEDIESFLRGDPVRPI